MATAYKSSRCVVTQTFSWEGKLAGLGRSCVNSVVWSWRLWLQPQVPIPYHKPLETSLSKCKASFFSARLHQIEISSMQRGLWLKHPAVGMVIEHNNR